MNRSSQNTYLDSLTAVPFADDASEGTALLENAPTFALANGARVDVAIAFVFVQGLRSLFEKDRDAFDALHAMASGDCLQADNNKAVDRLKAEGFLDEKGGFIPDLRDVIVSAVKTTKDGEVEVGFPFDKNDADQMALWASQTFKQWQALVRLRNKSGLGSSPTPTI